MLAYQDEIVDGKPRYRWYKLALNSVYMISDCDDKFDIHHCDFNDLCEWYEAAEWVAKNDADALKHIMQDRIPPVNDIVKEKLLAGLSRLGYYKSSAIVKKYLLAFPVSGERTKNRYLAKAEKYIETHVVGTLKGSYQMLEKLKKEQPDKLFDKNMQQALSVLLSIEFHLYDKCLDESLLYMEWMRINAPDKLKDMFSFELSVAIKEQLLRLLTEAELYRLHILIDAAIKEKSSAFYMEIPRYVRNPRDILSRYIDMDDDDD